MKLLRPMNNIFDVWSHWIHPSAGLPTVQWSVLLALAAMAGQLVKRYTGLPKIVGYSVLGTLAGWAGFSGAAWPLQGIGLFLLELGVAVVLFDAGGRISLRWFRHNPMVLVQSIIESALTFAAVAWALHALKVDDTLITDLALLAIVASPAVLSRVAIDSQASGPVTDRALVLSTLGTLYALTLCSARAGLLAPTATGLAGTLPPILMVLGVSVLVGALLALTLRGALRILGPDNENSAVFLLAVLAAGAAIAAHFGGSAPLAALLAGIIIKHVHPRPWAWPRPLGSASYMLTMLMFVLVSVVAAQADWTGPVAGVVAALVGMRLLAKIGGVALGNVGSGASWTQALWVACAMSPMSSVALLLVSQYVVASPALGHQLAGIALPAILLMEVGGAVLATTALYRAGESLKPWARSPQAPATGSTHAS